MQPNHSIARISGKELTLNYRLADSLQTLLIALATQGYRFTTVTPATHTRFLSHASMTAKNLRDVFGWNLPYEENMLPPLISEIMKTANLFTNQNGLIKSSVRVSSLENDLFLHSAFPTDEQDSVFFGPDTYRFARFIRQSIAMMQLQSNFTAPEQPLRILDVGCGSAAGGVAAVRSLPMRQPYTLSLNDINDRALGYAVANISAAGIDATILHSDFFKIPHKEYDLIISNPPYISDSEGGLYRDGGGNFGLDLSVRIARHALSLLAPGGHLLLYTGVAISHYSTNPLLAELAPQLSSGTYQWSYEEIDPDVFGEELDREEYRGVERIAVVGLIVKRLQ